MAEDAWNAEVARLSAWADESQQHHARGEELRERFESAAESAPAAHAAVAAAVDCSELGWSNGIPGAALIAVSRLYLPAGGHGEAAAVERELREGIAWASTPPEGGLPLLIADGEDAYRPSPALRSGSQVPPHTREWLLQHAPADQLLQIGSAAQIGKDGDLAERAWTRAVATGDATIQAAAWSALGEARALRGDIDAAIAALKAADTQALPALARPAVWFNLGLCHDRRGDHDEARRHYRRAIEAGHWQASPRAAYNLGLLLGELGDADGAEAAFADAIDARLYHDRTRALSALATVLTRLGELDRAVGYLERAIAADDFEVSAQAAVALGRLHERRGDTRAAQAAYERSVCTGEVCVIAEGIWRYAGLAVEHDPAVDPSAEYRRLLHRLPDYFSAPVALHLAEWCSMAHDEAAAVALLEQAMAYDGRDGAQAALWRGRIAQDQGDYDTAEAAYQRVIDRHAIPSAMQGMVNLGALHAERGHPERALEVFADIPAYPRGKATAAAAFNTAVLLERLGRTEDARVHYQRAVEEREAALLPRAVGCLHRLLTRQGRTGEADALLGQWPTPDEPELAADIAVEIARLASGGEPELVAEPW